MAKEQEKLVKEIRVMLQPSLYDEFHEVCVENYANLSNVVRGLIVEYIRTERDKRSGNPK